MASLLIGVISIFGIIVVVAIVFICARQHGTKATGKNSTSDEFKNLHEFLESIFGGRVLEFSFDKLNKTGVKTISEIRALEVKLGKSNYSNEVETLHLAFKAMRTDRDSAPQSNFFMKEINFYAEIVPAIEQFQEIVNMPENEKIDAFVRYFGSRLSLNPNVKIADEDAILLLENATSLNYTTPSMWNKFEEIDEVYACLKQLAKLHALWIAMRRLQPTLYYSKVNPHLHQVYDAAAIENAIKYFEVFYDDNILSTFPNISINVRSAFEHQLESGKEFFRNNEHTPDTPYTTFYHRDIHIKNFMIKRDEAEGKPIKMKILDFQGYNYNSFVFDLLQFLFYNVRIDHLRMHFKSFVEYYLLEFANVMRIANCPLDDYTNEKMWEEIKAKAKINLLYLYMNLAFEKDLIEHLKNSNHEHLSLDLVFNRWKCINELYIKHGFILID